MSAVTAFDEAVIQAVFALRTPTSTALMSAWTHLGDTLVVTAIVISISGVLLLQHRAALAVLMYTVVGGGALVSTVTKMLLDRPRPPIETALVPMAPMSSFPSGHALATLCLAVACVAIVRGLRWRASTRAWVAALTGANAVGVGFSRVYLGVHWPSDVLGAWVIGLVWCALVLYLDRRRGERGVSARAATRA